MKLMIASDIHGSSYYCKLMLEAFEREKADRLLLLGDILYHGPRNDLPREYAPKEVLAMLNGMKDRILCVRGNCDTEVDQMVLEFPIMADYAVVMIGNHIIYATHGHNYNETNLPPLQNGNILLNGHTHVPKYIVHENYIYMNPGSISIPKENSCNSYMMIDGNRFVWKNLENGTEYLEYKE
ncbi:MAG: phosphodiesterase [Anaerocolumna aminovalerica]|uniref:phosphodiesterase n=1 Tax=Anaerocolumna aminovalerica TaxID=1527 RepID=UPI00248CDAEE|nr:phosphodiesterase [Anaerocolumna aminovalerica]MDU6266585.1 phosphodiesterase [Anaerocolumna aminovalerica]